MTNKINDILEEFDTLTLEEQETVIDIERKRIIEKKRELLAQEVKEGEAEYNSGKLKRESVDEVMKAIDNEVNKNK